ncbi:hypothetical protein BD289DRAFT_213592 [Coniella lustricola]|uniref:Secreted protein n=1 Tax=Coniella lustricola TaxID=2025994 RepID=A0A2T3ABN9_9PEZI|nr:hypothetical protein BD289DRAFT_213592 [Coniella lustricola]
MCKTAFSGLAFLHLVANLPRSRAIKPVCISCRIPPVLHNPWLDPPVLRTHGRCECRQIQSMEARSSYSREATPKTNGPGPAAIRQSQSHVLACRNAVLLDASAIFHHAADQYSC